MKCFACLVTRGWPRTSDCRLLVHRHGTQPTTMLMSKFGCRMVTSTLLRFSHWRTCKGCLRRTVSRGSVLGRYFWASDMILVEDLTVESMTDAVDDPIANGEFTGAFRKVDGINGQQSHSQCGQCLAQHR